MNLANLFRVREPEDTRTPLERDIDRALEQRKHIRQQGLTQPYRRAGR